MEVRRSIVGAEEAQVGRCPGRRVQIDPGPELRWLPLLEAEPGLARAARLEAPDSLPGVACAELPGIVGMPAHEEAPEDLPAVWADPQWQNRFALPINCCDIQTLLLAIDCISTPGADVH